MNPRNVRILLLVATLLLLSAAAAMAADSKGCDGWCVALVDPATEQSLRLERVGYEIDMFGAVVSGQLVQEYINDASSVTAELRSKMPSALRGGKVEYEIDGEITVAVGGQEQREAKATSRRANKPAPRKAGPVRIELGADQSVIVRSSFTFQLPLKDGRLTMTLPAIRTGGAERSAETASFSYLINVHHDEPLGYAESSTHEVLVDFLGDRSLIELAAREEYASREFEVEIALGREDEPSVLGYASRERDGVREVLAVITPPSRPREGTSRPKQILFVLDTSGSMGKDKKLEQAREAMFASLGRLSATDAFNIVEFDGEFTMMAEEPLVATEDTLAEAREWLRNLRPGGNTKLLPALSAAIEQPEDTRRHEMIVLLTDGAVQNAAQVERMLRDELGQGRLFLVGIGEDVKRENIMRFAEVGRGTAVFATDQQSLDASLTRLFDQISAPLLWDVEIEFGTATVESIEPSRIPDLYGGRSITVRARVRGELPESIQVTGESMEGPRTYTTRLRAE